MRFYFLVRLIVFLTGLFLLIPGHGQKVAVVLSGGASRGAAHIGVLRALEENHIPIHYIVGTSIGAVVGGMYAGGMTPDEIARIMSSEEFQRWVSGLKDEANIYYYLKEDPNSSWITTDFKISHTLSSILPNQIVRGHEMDFHLMKMFSQANAVAGSNFDSLMIPFRCVIADIDSTHDVTLRSGDLSLAIRGSMSIPLVFSPAVIDQKLVFDGGMYNNFPCDVAVREFKPDVIIGSRVARRFKKPDRDDLVSQLLTMLMERQNDTIQYKNSVMIVPNIPVTGLMDFSESKSYADSGYAATIRKLADIRKLVYDTLSESDMAGSRESFNRRKPGLRFDSIHITGLGKQQSAYLRKVLKHGKQIVAIDDLQKSYFRFIDQGFTRSVFPVARLNPATELFDLYLDVQKAGNFTTQFGGNFSLANTSEAFIEFQYKYLWSNALRFYANGYFGKIYSSAKASGRIDFNSRLPLFLELAYTYNRFNYFMNATFFFDDKYPNYMYQSEYFGELRLGIPVTNKGKLVYSMTYAFDNTRYYQDNNFSSTDTTDQTNFTFFSPTLCFDLNGMNRKQYPNAGARLLIRLSYLYGLEEMQPGSTAIHPDPVSNRHDWFRLHVLYDNYFQAFGPLKLGFFGELDISNQPFFSNYISTQLYAPQFDPIPESQTYFLPSFRAMNYAATGLKAVVTLYKRLEYRLEAYIFQPYREIQQDPVDLTAVNGPRLSDHSIMGSTSLLYQSPLGPISLSVNYYEKKSEPFTINFNFGYILFNRRAIP